MSFRLVLTAIHTINDAGYSLKWVQVKLDTVLRKKVTAKMRKIYSQKTPHSSAWLARQLVSFELFWEKWRHTWKVHCTLKCIWVRSRRNCGCLATWFCYQLIAKPGNKTAAVSWPDPYLHYFCSRLIHKNRTWWDRFCHRRLICLEWWPVSGLVNITSGRWQE